EEFENGCSDRLVDAIVAWGTEDHVRDRIEAHLKAGATHVCIQPLRADGQPKPDMRAVEAFGPLNKSKVVSAAGWAWSSSENAWQDKHNGLARDRRAAGCGVRMRVGQ